MGLLKAEESLDSLNARRKKPIEEDDKESVISHYIEGENGVIERVLLKKANAPYKKDG